MIPSVLQWLVGVAATLVACSVGVNALLAAHGRWHEWRRWKKITRHLRERQSAPKTATELQHMRVRAGSRWRTAIHEIAREGRRSLAAGVISRTDYDQAVRIDWMERRRTRERAAIAHPPDGAPVIAVTEHEKLVKDAVRETVADISPVSAVTMSDVRKAAEAAGLNLVEDDEDRRS